MNPRRKLLAIHRVWVNQPSTLQPYHSLHGTEGLAVKKDAPTTHFYFLSGPVHHQEIAPLALSAGWPSCNAL